MPRRGLPSGDLASFGGVVRRTAILRAALALALLVAVALTAEIARGREVRQAGLLPTGTTGMIVLDASKSVAISGRIGLVLPHLEPNIDRVATVLRQLAERDEPVGLVLFSDVAYELLPPESPGRALAPLVRFFTPRTDLDDPEADPIIPNPWADSFSGGTLISGGLLTALEALRRDGVERPAILLVSDLDAPADRPRLTEALVRIRSEGVRIRIVSLAPGELGQELFTRILGEDVFVEPEELGVEDGEAIERRIEGVSPRPLVLLGGLVLLLVGVHERLLARLPVPARRGAR